MSDDTRRRILERRAAFVAAFASFAVNACSKPEPCLSAVPNEMKKGPTDAGSPELSEDASIAPPAVCLSESPHPCLAPPPIPTTDARPTACLSKAIPKPKPTPCLEFVE